MADFQALHLTGQRGVDTDSRSQEKHDTTESSAKEVSAAVAAAFDGLFSVVHAPSTAEREAASATANKSLRVMLFAMGRSLLG